MKLTRPKQALVKAGQGWTEDFPDGLIETLGTLEDLAAIGLIVPPLIDTATVLVPLDATGLVLLMLGAAATHARRRESTNVAVNLVLGGLALFLAVERFGAHSF